MSGDVLYQKQTQEKRDAAGSGLNMYMSRMYRKGFPRVDMKGRVFTAPEGLVGRQSVNGREYYACTKLKQFLDMNFPQGCIHHATAPESRALEHRKKNAQTTLSFAPKKAAAVVRNPWPEYSCYLTAKEFEVPRSTPILLFFPEIFDRDILIKHPEIHFKYTDEDNQ